MAADAARAASMSTAKRARRIRAELKKDLATFFQEDSEGNVNVRAVRLEDAGALAAAIAVYDRVIREEGFKHDEDK